MRNLLFPLCLLFCGLLGVFQSSIQAQSYNPFPGAHTFSYTFNYPGDTFLHALRVDSIYALGQDTVHEFNEIYRLNDSLDWLGGCSPNPALPAYVYDSAYRYYAQPNVFGHHMLQRPNGRYDFVNTTFQDTFRLETTLPVGSSWLVNAPRNLTATFDSTTWHTFQGVADSVQHISLCNGKRIALSKHHGFVEAVPWIPVHHRGLPAVAYPPQYTLRAINETGLGPALPDIFGYFDFGANDRFQYWDKVDAGLWVDEEQYTEKTIQTWGPTLPGIGGTVSEEYVRFEENFGVMDTFYQAPTLVFDSVQVLYLSQLTDVLPSASWTDDTTYAVEFVLETAQVVNERLEITLRVFNCGPNGCVPGVTGTCEYYVFRENLGQYYHFRESPYGQDTEIRIEELICWETSWGMGGTCVNLLALATDVAEGAAPPSVTVHAAPATGRLRLKVPRETLSLSLYGMNGQQVWSHEHWDTGQEMIEVDVPELAAGIYILEVEGATISPFRQKIRWIP